MRISQLDFIKGVMIVLMVAFHLVYIGDTYPHAKMIVYSFHMPCFLIISGYLNNPNKERRQYLHSLLRILLPYLALESAYIVGASVLPIREHIDHLTPLLFIDKLLLHPLGPYWYLHNIMLFTTIAYSWHRTRISGYPLHIAVLLSLLSVHMLGIASLTSITYFYIGYAMRQYHIEWTRAFRPSWFAVIPVALIAILIRDLHSATPTGLIMVYCVLSLLNRASVIQHPLTIISRLGQTTLPILLYSPVFTLLAKTYQPWLVSLDPSGILFLAITLPVAIYGSLLINSVSPLAK